MKKIMKMIIVLGVIFALGQFSNRNYVKAEDSQQEKLELVKVDVRTGKREVIEIDNSTQYDVNEIVSEGYSPYTSKFNDIDNQVSTRGIVGGIDDRELVQNTSQYPYRAIARLTMKYADGTYKAGSGFMISKNVMATAGHCLTNSDGYGTVEITAEFGQNGSYVYKRATDMVCYIYYPGFTHDQYDSDYGFVVFGSDVGLETGYFGIIQNPSIGDSVVAAGYPGGNECQLYKGNGVLYNMGKCIAYLTCDITNGQSGGPVYKYVSGSSVPYAIGMISGGYGDQYTFARRLEPEICNWLVSNGYLTGADIR